MKVLKGYVTEAGEVEKWVGGVNKQRAEESLEDVIKYLEGTEKIIFITKHCNER
jgi:hypothetical protein